MTNRQITNFQIASTGSANNQVLTSNGTAVVWANGGSSSSSFITINQPGYISSPYNGINRFYPPKNITINKIYASVSSIPTSNITFKIFKNGTDTGDTYQINSGNYVVSNVSASITANTTDYLTLNMVTGIPYNLIVQMQYSTV